MSLPADGVNANALVETTTIPTGKKLIFLDPDTNEGGIITLENLTKQILSNLATQTFNLDQGTKTLLAALNELNSKRSFIRIETRESRNTIVITPKNENEAYHFSAFCFGDANGVYCTATISSIKQESTACSVSKIDDSYEIVIGRWGLLNVVSAQAFSYSIK